MGKSRPWARRHDAIEGGPFGTPFFHTVLEFEGQLRLLHLRRNHLQNRFPGLFRNGDGLAYRVDLFTGLRSP